MMLIMLIRHIIQVVEHVEGVQIQILVINGFILSNMIDIRKGMNACEYDTPDE